MIGIPTIDITRPNGVWLNCEDCLYGSGQYCPSGVTLLCSRYLGWNYSRPEIGEKVEVEEDIDE